MGLLCDDVTDISVLEQFVCFVQFFDSESGKLQTDFLLVENVLKDSDSQDPHYHTACYQPFGGRFLLDIELEMSSLFQPRIVTAWVWDVPIANESVVFLLSDPRFDRSDAARGVLVDQSR